MAAITTFDDDLDEYGETQLHHIPTGFFPVSRVPAALALIKKVDNG